MRDPHYVAVVHCPGLVLDRIINRWLSPIFVLQGSIAPRTIVRDDPDTPGKKKEYGPYHQWTWKRDGKTVTVNLSEAQAVRYQKALDENKKLESLLQQLRTVSLELLEATTQGVPKRAKRRE